MSRTPLFHLVRRSLRLAHASLSSSMPLDEMLESARDAATVERKRRTISRRRFVALGSTAAAGVALQGCVSRLASPRATGRPVLIIGAGLAGLAAGHRLRQAGVPVRIVEAQRRTGGRMLSLRDYFADGQVCELGGELIDTGHERIRALAAELGIELDDLSSDDPSLDRDIWYFGGQRRSDAEVVAAFRPIAARIAADLATIGGGDVSFRAPNGAESLDRMTLEQWLDRAGTSGWIRALLSVGYTTEFGLEPDRQSALNLLTMIDTEPDPFRIFGESDERFHVRGGNDLITRALAERLQDAIETGVRLEAVRALPGGALRCSVRRDETSEEIDAEHVVIAIPFTLLRDVRLDVPLPGPKRRAIEELGYGSNAKLMLGTSSRVWRTRYRSNGSTLADLPYQLSWETSRLQPGDAGIITNFTGGTAGVRLGAGTAAERAREVSGQLDQLFPGFAAARSGMREARFHWPSHPFTRGSYACYLPGQWTGIAGVEGERVGRLHFAGEHCSSYAQGFMEGACETGERAAREVLSDLGVPRDALLPALGRRIARGVERRLAAVG